MTAPDAGTTRFLSTACSPAQVSATVVPHEYHMLNPYAQRFADRLFAVRPQWRTFAKAEPNGDLTVTIAAPYQSGAALHIYAEGEITIRYDQWHTHFDMWNDGNEEEEFADALECVDALIAEKMCVVITQRSSGSFASSSTLNVETLPESAEDGDRVYVRSWRGTCNKEYLKQSP